MEANEQTTKNFFVLYPFFKDLIAGACCGLAVDSVLFPIDTCKTRIQSENGFLRAGGFRGIYNGILPVIAASMPIAATFFCVYGAVNSLILSIPWSESEYYDSFNTPEWAFFFGFLINSFAASLGEMCAGLIRTPTEIVKQKRQVSEIQYRAIDILMHAYKTEGLINGIYRGYGITIMRDIPFAMIQYPVYELLKSLSTEGVEDNYLKLFLQACVGSVAGAIASALTTPLDVAKTRIQLADQEPNPEYKLAHRSPWRVWRTLYKQRGIPGLFGGFVPRVMWTTVGGFIWFGTNEVVSKLLVNL